MKVSVVLAAYNGEQYISEQIKTILMGLGKEDELIISDDGSDDATVNIVNEFVNSDKRVIFVKGPAQGVVKNFENALKLAKGEIIFFADQDDIWDSDKIKKVVAEFEKDKNIWLVLHDMFLSTDEQIIQSEKGIKSFAIRKRRHGVIYNFLYSGYYGCCMAISKKLLDIVLPFPDDTNMYDQLIGLIAEKNRKSLFLKDPLIVHRLHGNNMSKRKGILNKIKYRAVLLKAYTQVLKRGRKKEQAK